MYPIRFAVSSACALALATVALAQPTRGVTVVTGNPTVQRVAVTETESTVYVVQRPVVEPAATVDRALSQQPVRPFLIEVQVANTTVYLDPQVDYQGDRSQRVDDNFSLLRAQRLARSLAAPGVTVVRGSPANPTAATDVQPVWILPKPQRVSQPPNSLPAVPEAQEMGKQVALAK